MNTDHNDYFIAIAENGTLSAAAKSLGITQPVLSRYLSKLEEELGAKLFISKKNIYRPTREGQIYLKGIRQIKALESQMLYDLDTVSDTHHEIVHLGVSPFHGAVELAYLYPRLMSEHPEIELQVSSHMGPDLFKQLKSGSITIMSSMVTEDFSDPEISVATLARSELFLAVPGFHSLAPLGGNIASPTELKPELCPFLSELPFIYLDSTTTIGKCIENIINRLELPIKSFSRTPNTMTMLAMMETGTYCGFLRSENAKQFPHFSFFRIPRCPALFSAMMFMKDHELTFGERLIYSLQLQRIKQESDDDIYVNETGRKILGGSKIL